MTQAYLFRKLIKIIWDFYELLINKMLLICNIWPLCRSYINQVQTTLTQQCKLIIHIFSSLINVIRQTNTSLFLLFAVNLQSLKQCCNIYRGPNLLQYQISPTDGTCGQETCRKYDIANTLVKSFPLTITQHHTDTLKVRVNKHSLHSVCTTWTKRRQKMLHSATSGQGLHRRPLNYLRIDSAAQLKEIEVV